MQQSYSLPYGQHQYSGSYQPQQRQYYPQQYGGSYPPAADPRRPYVQRQVTPWDKGLAYTPTKKSVIIGGLAALCVLWALPVWDALSLLSDFNSVYWLGEFWPLFLIFSGGASLIAYFALVQQFSSSTSVRTVNDAAAIASLVILLVGIAHCLTSFPLHRNATATYNMLMYRCQSSDDARELMVYYMSAQGLRQTPECSQKDSIEECLGYRPHPRYSPYLMELEKTFRCSGFCWDAERARSAHWANRSMAHWAPEGDGPELPDFRDGIDGLPLDSGLSVSLLSASQDGAASHQQPGRRDLPPALFSRASFQVSCDGKAARELLSFSRMVADELGCIGVVLVMISIGMAISNWGVKEHFAEEA